MAEALSRRSLWRTMPRIDMRCGVTLWPMRRSRVAVSSSQLMACSLLRKQGLLRLYATSRRLQVHSPQAVSKRTVETERPRHATGPLLSYRGPNLVRPDAGGAALWLAAVQDRHLVLVIDNEVGLGS